MIWKRWMTGLAGLTAGAAVLALLPEHTLFTPTTPKTASATGPTGERYACPMMDFIGTRPGDCPVCGMKMTKVTAGELTAEQQRRMGIELVRATEGPATATVRARLGNVSDLASTTWDTGAIAPQTGPDAGGNVVLLHPASASGRYLRLDVADPDAAALDIGRIVAGPLWRLAHAPAFGIAEGRQILDRRERNGFTGAEFPVPAVVNPRSTSFTLPLITRAEATAEFRGMLAALGAAGDALWILDDSLSLAELNLRAIWGAIAQPGESALLARPYFNGHTRNFQITERI